MFCSVNFFLNGFFFSKNCLISFFIDQTCLIPFLAKTEIGIILSQKQAIFCTAGHHSVRLMVFFCYKIIDQYANISLRAIQYKLFLTFYFHCGIDSGNQPLCGSFFISGTSVKLSAAEQTFNFLKLQCRIKLTRIDAVIFNCIGIFYDFCMLKARNRMIHGILYILRKRAGHSADIHFIRIKSFWFDKYLVAVFICKTNDFILDGRAVSRSGSLDHSGI